MTVQLTSTQWPDARRTPPAAAGSALLPELSIVVPTYREAANVADLVAALDQALAGIAWEVIFVDDDSPDGTIKEVRAIAEQDHRVRGLRRIGRRGLSGAAIEGICASSAEFVCVMDGDLQHDERLLPSMLAALKAGADIAIASRYSKGGSGAGGLNGGRLRGSRLATALSNFFLKTDVTDPMSGHFMMRRATFEPVAPRLSTAGFKILLDILSSLPKSLKVREFAFDFRVRHAGESKLDELVVAEFLGLLVSKATGGLVSLRFLMFALVGTSGIAVHLTALNAVFNIFGLPFEASQLAAAYAAMTWNFFLNNLFTYRDRRLTGFGLIKGLVSFYLICSVGTVANVGVAQLVYDSQPNWIVAGLAGALMAAVFNFAMTSVFTWGKS